MTGDQFEQTVMELPVWDTHTHLDTSEYLSAQSFWDIAHYFWYNRELEGAGYPSNAEDLSEDERTDACLSACHRNRNTAWNNRVFLACKSLFGVEISNKKSIQKINSRIEKTASDPDWPMKVCSMAGISRIGVSGGTTNQLDLLGEVPFLIPIVSALSRDDEQAFDRAGDKARAPPVGPRFNARRAGTPRP